MVELSRMTSIIFSLQRGSGRGRDANTTDFNTGVAHLSLHFKGIIGNCQWLRLPRPSTDVELYQLQLVNEVSAPLFPFVAWRGPYPAALVVLTSPLTKANCTVPCTESRRGRVVLHLRIYQLHRLIVALSQHNTAEYVNLLPRPVLFVDKHCQSK